MEFTPVAVLAILAGGMALGSSVVAYWRIVGSGFVWLGAVTVALLGATTGIAGGGAVAIGASVAAAAAVFFGKDQLKASALFGVATVGFLIVATSNGTAVAAVTGSLFLGGIVSEMLLGHWYLVDPQLPRWALQRLALIGGAGLVADTLFVAIAAGDFMADPFLGYAFIALTAMTVLLVLGVWFSLKEPNYTGVMAATGLSYLA
ncbi:MAG TPA: hypothetical protein ENG98_04915, partial [Actinobacteria bacterium]|nr:hypothetical protein [Actinomycetota bacterium]